MLEEEESMEGNCDNPSPLLNEDSLIQILLWLPVISLLRFKSVCKSWRAIIENPFFIHSHATFPPTTTTINKVGSPIFLRLWHRKGNTFTVSGNEFEVFEDLGTPGPEFEALEDLRPGDMKTMVGCCNGIICLHGTKTIFDHFPKCYLWSIISLWNPAIKQCRLLQIPFELQGNHEDAVNHFVGFGFDVKTKEYKVLLIIHGTKNKDDQRYYLYPRGVHVYSLSTDSWRCIDATSFSDAQSNLIQHRDYWNQGHYLNGTYLFIAGYLYDGEFQEATSSRQKCFKHVIMSFDFTEEIFRTIQLPFDLTPLNTNYANVILFGENIAVIKACHVHSDFGSLGFDIWVLNEYGGNESWSKFYTFVSNSEPEFITDNGEFILLNGGNHVKKLKLLNVVTGEIKNLQCDFEGPSEDKDIIITRVGVYKPSLIPIAGNGATDHCLQVLV